MISIVFGVPGSGKTYYGVWWIKKRALIDSDIFLRVRDDVILITNLRLNLDSQDGYVYIEDIKDFAKYLDVDFWRANFAWLQSKKVYIVIDECQLFFYHFKDDPRVLFFLQYHRHLSVDILFITQTPKSLPAKVFELAEFLFEAVPRSVNPFSFKAFRYRVLHPFDRDIVLRRFHLVFDYVVFYLYSDMIYKSPEESEEKPRNAFTRYYLLVSSFVLLTVFSMFFFLSRVFSPSPSQDVAHSPRPYQYEYQYEDLIREVSNSSEEKSKGFKEDTPEDSPGEAKGSYYIDYIKVSGSLKEDALNPSGPGPKVIEIP